MSVQKGTHHSVSPSVPVHPQQQGTRPQQSYYPQGQTPPVQYRQDEYQQIRQQTPQPYFHQQKQFQTVPHGGNPHDMSKTPMSTTVPNPGQGPNPQIMYQANQGAQRTPFYPPRQAQPQGIPQQAQRHVRMSASPGQPPMYPYTQTNVLITQPGNYMPGQPQATMMMPGNLQMQASPGQYMGEDMVSMSGGATIIYQAGARAPPQYTINTSQPNQLGMPSPVTPNYQQQGPVTYYTPAQQYHMNAQQNRPPSTPSSYSAAPAPQKEKKIIRISDPSTGQDVTDDIISSARSGKTGTPPLSGPSSARATPVVSQAEDGVAQQGAAVAATVQANSNIAAQFASQVAAALNPETSRPAQPQLTKPVDSELQLDDNISQTATSNLSETVNSSGGHSERTDVACVQDVPDSTTDVDLVASDAAVEIPKEEEVEEVAEAEEVVVAEPEPVAEPESEQEQPCIEGAVQVEQPDTSQSDNVVERTASEPDSVSEVHVEEEPVIVVVTPSTPVPEEPAVVKPVEPAPAVVEETPELKHVEGKGRTKKQKQRDLNERGKAKEGSDMDLFTEETTGVQKPEPVAEPAETPAPVVETNNIDQKVDHTPAKVEVKVEESNEAKVQEKNEKNEGKTIEESKDKSEKIERLKKDKSAEKQYKYKEELSSPLSPERKNHYDRDFLLSLQFTQISKAKPDGLPKLPDVILDRPRSMGDTGGRSPLIKPGSQPDFTPGFIKSSITPRMSGGGGGGGGVGGGRMGGRRGSEQGRKEPKKIILEVPLAQPIELHHAEKAWKPTYKEEEKVAEPELSATEDLYKKVRSILNKLTPQKFQVLMNQILEFQIDTEEKLRGVIDLIFEKAIDEPNFSVPYAHMCKHMMMIKVPNKSGGKLGDTVLFRKFLLTRCQKEFEKDKANEIELSSRQKAIDEAESEEKKKLLQEHLDYEAAKSKRRSLGNIRFIGELFKLKMLTENIMHDCLVKLLRSNDEDNLECLCRLLATIGKDIDHEKAKPRIDQYFAQMDKIVKQKRTSSRVRFMLQDVMELRMNNWVPRRDENKPKTIDQIHQEVAREKQEEQFLLTQHAAQQPKKRHMPGGRGGGGGQFGAQQQSEDGWKTVSTKNTIDPSKMKLSKQTPVDENSIQLGPGGRTGFSWGRGSSGGSKQNQEAEARPSTPSNRFSALSQADGYDSRGRGAGRGMGPRQQDRGRQQAAQSGPRGHDRGKNTRMSQEMERESALQAVRHMNQPRQSSTGRQGGSREGSRNRDSRDDVEPVEVSAPKKVEAEAPKHVIKEMSDEEMERKTKAIIDEFLHLQDMKEAMFCIKELESHKNISVLVSTTLNHVLERSEKARQQAGQLLHNVVKRNTISVSDYLKGLGEVLEYAEDMEIDIPKIWTYFGELIGPMVQDGSVPMGFLKDACKPLYGGKAGTLVAAILHDASHRLGHIKVGEMWRQSTLQWSDFLSPQENVTAFLKANKLEFTAETPHHVTRSLSIENIMDQLRELLSRKGSDNEEVFDWIEENVGEQKAKDAKFIRALMTEVCASAIEGSGSTAKLDDRILKKRSVVLQKFLDHQAELELQALYALQALVNKLEHPPGLLQMYFDTLYDEDIISEDAFYTWESSEDAGEQEGKGVAKKSVVRFFTWLKEAEENPGDDS